jgi:hypothetical protein
VNLLSTGVIQKKTFALPKKNFQTTLNNFKIFINQSINHASGVVGGFLVGVDDLASSGRQMRGGDGFFLSGCLRRQFAAGVRP